MYSSYLSHMTRPSRDDDHDCVRIKSQALSELGHVVKVNWKAWRYNTKEVFFEVRSVLDDFFEKDETSWETARILKKQMGIVKEVFEMLGLKFWGEFLPNHKSYISNKDVFDNESVPTKFIRNEFSVSTLGLVVWLAVWSENRKGRFDKDKLRAMLNAFFTLELDPSSSFSTASSASTMLSSMRAAFAQTRPCHVDAFGTRCSISKILTRVGAGTTSSL